MNTLLRLTLLFTLIFHPNLGQASFEYESLVDLKWDRVTLADHYEIQIIDTNNKIVEREESKKTELTVVLEAGKYRYRIRAVDVLDREGTWSEFLGFLVQPGPPRPSGILGGKTALVARNNTPIDRKLSWDAPTNNSNYSLKVYKDRNVLLTKKVEGGESVVTLPGPGKYGYSLASVQDDIVGPYSKQTLFVILGRPELKAVDILFPTSDQILTDGEVRFEWVAQARAEKYHLRIFQVGTLRQGGLVEYKDFWVNTVEFVETFPKGHYYFLVEAFDDAGIGTIGRTRRFSVE